MLLFFCGTCDEKLSADRDERWEMRGEIFSLFAFEAMVLSALAR